MGGDELEDWAAGDELVEPEEGEDGGEDVEVREPGVGDLEGGELGEKRGSGRCCGW